MRNPLRHLRQRCKAAWFTQLLCVGAFQPFNLSSFHLNNTVASVTNFRFLQKVRACQTSFFIPTEIQLCAFSKYSFLQLTLRPMRSDAMLPLYYQVVTRNSINICYTHEYVFAEIIINFHFNRHTIFRKTFQFFFLFIIWISTDTSHKGKSLSFSPKHKSYVSLPLQYAWRLSQSEFADGTKDSNFWMT